MDVELVNIVTNVGFPIAIACYMVWFMNNDYKEKTSEIVKQLNQLENAIVRLTVLIEKLENRKEV